MSRYLLHSFQLPASLMLPCQATLLPSQSQALSNKRPMSFPQLWGESSGREMVFKNQQTARASHYLTGRMHLMKALLLKHQHSFTIYIFTLHCFYQISVSLIHILFGTSVTFLENQLSYDLPAFLAELWARPWAGSEFGVFKCHLSGDVGCTAGIRHRLSFL